MNKWFLILLSMITTTAFATWQVASPTPKLGIKHGLGGTHFPGEYNTLPAYSAYLQKGPLYKSVERIANQYHWRVLWKAPQNDMILMNTTISGPTFEKMMNQIFSHYSLNINYDTHHRAMVVCATSKCNTY